MATSLLRLGRLGSLKCLQLESWGILRSHPAMMFCSGVEDTTKSTTKTEAANKTGAQDERAALLAYKTAVAFPVRFSKPEVSSAQYLGVAEPVSSSAAAAAARGPLTDAGEPAGAVPQMEDITATSSNLAPDPDISHVASDPSLTVSDTTPADKPLASSVSEGAVPTTKASSEPHDPVADGSSSSSSSSDSDSDSDSDDEKSEAKTQTKTYPPKMTESAMKEETVAHEVTSELKYGTKEDNKEAPSKHKYTPVYAVEAVQETSSSSPLTAVTSAVKAAQATLETPLVTLSDSSEELVDSAPVFCTAAEDTLEVTPAVPNTHRETPAVPNTHRETPAVPNTHGETPAEVVAEVASPEKNPCHNSVSTEPAHSAQIHVEGAAFAPVEAAAKPLEVEIAPTEAAAEHAADDSTHMESTEELMDPARVIAEGAGADPHVEATVEEQKVAPPDPEDPFDNSTYKNYQHHSYTPFTFVDLDVEMAKFRLPQPSSGRPSPRH